MIDPTPLLHRTVVLLSGGHDSAYCALVAKRRRAFPVAVFFDYGQPYLDREVPAAEYVASELGMTLFKLKLPAMKAAGGIFDNRNEKFLAAVVPLGARAIYFGCRNPMPWDKYGDSNWWWARRMAKKYGLPIRTPVMCLPKQIVNAVIFRHFDFERLFSSEGLS